MLRHICESVSLNTTITNKDPLSIHQINDQTCWYIHVNETHCVSCPLGQVNSSVLGTTLWLPGSPYITHLEKTHKGMWSSGSFKGSHNADELYSITEESALQIVLVLGYIVVWDSCLDPAQGNLNLVCDVHSLQKQTEFPGTSLKLLLWLIQAISCRTKSFLGLISQVQSG